MTATLGELRAKLDEALAVVQAAADIADVQAALQQAGVAKARGALDNALSELKREQTAKRAADNAERQAKEAVERAVIDAESVLVPPKATKGENGETLVDGREVVSWVAADKAAWRKQQAAQDPGVQEAVAALRHWEQVAAECRDAVVLADKRFKACEADLDAAVAVLRALSAALPGRKEN